MSEKTHPRASEKEAPSLKGNILGRDIASERLTVLSVVILLPHAVITSFLDLHLFAFMVILYYNTIRSLSLYDISLPFIIFSNQ